MANFVLDSYAVLTPLTDDMGADEVREVLTNPEHRFRMELVNSGEVHYVLSRTGAKRRRALYASCSSMRTSMWSMWSM